MLADVVAIIWVRRDTSGDAKHGRKGIRGLAISPQQEKAKVLFPFLGPHSGTRSTCNLCFRSRFLPPNSSCWPPRGGSGDVESTDPLFSPGRSPSSVVSRHIVFDLSCTHFKLWKVTRTGSLVVETRTRSFISPNSSSPRPRMRPPGRPGAHFAPFTPRRAARNASGAAVDYRPSRTDWLVDVGV